MTETIRTAATPSYASQFDLAAPPEVVFEALATVSGITGWWTTTVDGSATEGAELRLRFPNDGGHPLVLRVDDATRPENLEWTVLAAPPVSDWAEWADTRISFRLHPTENGGTAVAFQHDGLTERLHCYDHCSRGWDGVLASLRHYLGTGSGHPFN